MLQNSQIYVAGSSGLVGSAVVRQLKKQGFSNIFTTKSADLDLTDQAATRKFFQEKKPDYVFVCAARVGGILANSTYPAEFAYQNLMIQTNLIHSSYLTGVKKLLFLGSSCIYPKDTPVPIQESALLTGPLEPTNEAYAIAKITGVKLCDYYREQYGCNYISVMPTNVYGPGDNFDLKAGHMLAALIHKFHLAKNSQASDVTVWGTGKPRREMIHVDDVADGLLFLMKNYSEKGIINLGTGLDYSIQEIAEKIGEVTQFQGKLVFDASKPDGVFRKVMDVSRIQKLGWKASISLDEGIRSTYQWFTQNFDRIRNGQLNH